MPKAFPYTNCPRTIRVVIVRTTKPIFHMREAKADTIRNATTSATGQSAIGNEKIGKTVQTMLQVRSIINAGQPADCIEKLTPKRKEVCLTTRQHFAVT